LIPYFLVKLGGIAARLEHEPEDPSSPSSKGAEKGNFLEKHGETMIFHWRCYQKPILNWYSSLPTALYI
jgi:hypothetical protein